MLVDRSLFPVTSEWTYLDHAAVSPLSTPVREAMLNQIDGQCGSGYVVEPRWEVMVEEIRGELAQLVGADEDEIGFVGNTAIGISIFAAGLDWQPGDNVITNSAEYPTNVYPWLNLESRFGVTTKLVAPRSDRRIPVEDVIAAADDHTRAIALSFVEFASGYRNDLAAIGRWCRDHEIWFVVDGIQGVGVIPIDVRASAIDFMAVGGHKWLLGPLGTGFFYCGRELLSHLWTSLVGQGSIIPTSDYLDYQFELRPAARRYEAGAPNFAGILGLGASIRLLRSIGIDRIEAHVLQLHDRLIQGLEERGYGILSPLGPGERSGILVFESPKVPPNDLAASLEQQRIKVSPRGGGVRVSPHCYNNEADIDRLLEALP